MNQRALGMVLILAMLIGFAVVSAVMAFLQIPALHGVWVA